MTLDVQCIVQVLFWMYCWFDVLWNEGYDSCHAYRILYRHEYRWFPLIKCMSVSWLCSNPGRVPNMAILQPRWDALRVMLGMGQHLPKTRRSRHSEEGKTGHTHRTSPSCQPGSPWPPWEQCGNEGFSNELAAPVARWGCKWQYSIHIGQLWLSTIIIGTIIDYHY